GGDVRRSRDGTAPRGAAGVRAGHLRDGRPRHAARHSTRRSHFRRGRNDHVYGLGGNDVLIGGPGRDVVEGSVGSDRLLLRDGAGEVARCGPGNDTVVADDLDTVWGDCETVLEPGLPPPPPGGLVPGPYAGKTSQGEDVSFLVSSGGQLTKLTFAVIH